MHIIFSSLDSSEDLPDFLRSKKLNISASLNNGARRSDYLKGNIERAAAKDGRQENGNYIHGNASSIYKDVQDIINIFTLI